MSKTLVLSRVFPPQVGGSGRWMWELYSRMPVGDFLVVAGNWPGSAEFDTRQKLPIERLPLHLASWGAFGWRRGAEYYALYQRVRALVREHHVRTLHAACCLPEGFLAWMLRRRYGIPYQVYVHGEELNVARTSRELTWMTRRVFDNAQTIVANSRNTAGLLRTGWNAAAERIHVLHPGVDTGRYQPVPRELEARQRLGWGSDTVILSVGRLQRRKGHAQIVRALPEIRKVVPDVLFAIVGDGDEREPLRQLIDQLGVQDQVRLHGELAGDDLLTAYQQCDLFALANREVDGDIEGFGIVLLEAQACGKPVVAGDSGGTPETMNSPVTGLVIDSSNVAVVASTIQGLLLDGERRERMGAAARRWVVKNFDWSVRLAAAQALFRESDAGGNVSPYVTRKLEPV